VETVDVTDRYPLLKSLDLTGLLAHPCPIPRPDSLLRLEFDGLQHMPDGEVDWVINTHLWWGFGRSGQPYLLAELRCRSRNDTHWEYRNHLVLLDREPNGWRAMAEVEPDLPSTGWSITAISGRVITLDIPNARDSKHLVAYVWDGTTFVRLTEDRMGGGGRGIG
jgi:hypothetical protein